MINEVIVGGLLSKYHDIKMTSTGRKMATFSLWQKKKDFQQYVPVLAFDRQAEFFETYVKDGMFLVCTGELNVRSQQTPDGKKVNQLSFIANKIDIVYEPKTEQPKPAPQIPKDPGYPNSFPRKMERYSDDMWSRAADQTGATVEINPDELPF